MCGGRCPELRSDKTHSTGGNRMIVRPCKINSTRSAGKSSFFRTGGKANTIVKLSPNYPDRGCSRWRAWSVRAALFRHDAVTSGLTGTRSDPTPVVAWCDRHERLRQLATVVNLIERQCAFNTASGFRMDSVMSRPLRRLPTWERPARYPGLDRR